MAVQIRETTPAISTRFEREVRKGLDDLDAGRTVSHGDVVKGLRELGLDVN